MINFQLKNLVIISFLFVFVFIVSASTHAQPETVAIDINLSTNNVAIESKIEVKLLVTSHKPINAFDLILEYPQECFEFIQASTANSIVSVWQSLPLKAKEGSVRLTGGMIEPFLGKGEIITLIFQAKKTGDATFVMKKTDFVLADGKGTTVSTLETRQFVSIIENEGQTKSELTSSAPQISEILITQDPLEKKTIIKIKTEDDGAVEGVYIRSREWILWNDWEKTQLLTAIPKGAWAIQAMVVGWDGSESSEIIYRWEVITPKILLVILFMIIAWYVSKKIIKIWKSKKEKI